MCYFEDCEDRYWPPEDNTPDCPYEDCDNSTDTGNTNPGGTGSTNPGGSGNTGASGGQSQGGNCPCDCDNSTDTGNTNPGNSGNTKPGGSHICICNCDDCADGTCGTTRYYKPGESFCLYNASHSDLYAWSTNPSNIKVNPDGTVQVIQGSAYICIRSRSNPAFRHCIHVVATNTPPNGGNTQPGGNGSAVTGIEISGDSYGYVSDRLTMSCTVSPANAVNKTIYWDSSNPNVASINSCGILRCLRPGKTYVSATSVDGGFTDGFCVTVYAKCERVTIEVASDTMAAGTTQSIWAVACPPNTRQKFCYDSSNTTVASVSTNGIITAHTPGTAHITVYFADDTHIYTLRTIQVVPAVTGISISGPSYGLTGGTVSMGYQVRPSGAVGKNVIWRSQYPSIASVDANGTVTCHRIGQTCIYVTTQDGRFTDRKTLTVYDPCTAVIANVQRTAMVVGGTQTLSATVQPSTAMQSLSYSSSNSGIVSVSVHGVLTALAPGSVEITVTSVTNPDKQITLTVTVYKSPLSNIQADIENGRFRIKNAWLKKWVCTASSGTVSSLHIASDTSNYEDTFDFIEIDGYYAISLTTASGTFYIGENPGQDPFALVHTVMMPRITSLCMVPDCCLWEIFETASGEYSFRNVESQYFLYSTGDVLRTTKLDVILGNPAMYPCFWNILNAASNELNMPVNLNQKYKGIQDPYVGDYGCCLCSIGNILSYYEPEKTKYPHGYSVQDLIDRNWWKHFIDNGKTKGYAIFPNLIIWGPHTPISSDTNEFFTLIKKEIDSGYPVLLHYFNKENDHEHWTVAYKYTDNCQNTQSIFVLDSANYANTESAIGLRISLQESIDMYDYKEVGAYKTTAPKTN